MPTIKQSVTIKASPKEVYEALLDSKKHSLITGDTAKMSRTVGGSWSAFGGYATGKNLELVPNKKIVQTWRASDWPAGHESTATFSLAKTKDGTKIVFTHVHVPANQIRSIAGGWQEYYWEPLKRFFSE
ncbi:MAG: SRPBCC domain-containing protein [Candidatus Kerfeldbacteria bacterium]|nr:SRPBCC domain-containing protein [Candidatus Kerfeldbacteria bacterium]